MACLENPTSRAEPKLNVEGSLATEGAQEGDDVEQPHLCRSPCRYSAAAQRPRAPSAVVSSGQSRVSKPAAPPCIPLANRSRAGPSLLCNHGRLPRAASLASPPTPPCQGEGRRFEPDVPLQIEGPDPQEKSSGFGPSLLRIRRLALLGSPDSRTAAPPGRLRPAPPTPGRRYPAGSAAVAKAWAGKWDRGCPDPQWEAPERPGRPVPIAAPQGIYLSLFVIG